jgi:ribosomal protein S18 acetylase RimI-like enzyme
MTVQTGPDRRLLDETIIEWIENVWGMDKDKIVIPSFADDAWRQNILKKRGYRLAGSRGFLRKYDVNLSPHQAPLEDKFVLSDLGRSKDTDGVIGVVSKACGSDLIDREWFMSRQNAPGFQPGTVVQAMSSKGICVSCAGARIDWKQNYAEIELIATHPDFQKKGLAKACLAECFKRLSDMKVRYAYIGPTNMSSHSYRLFESMLPIEKVEEFSWELAR